MSAPIYGRWAIFWSDADHPGIDRMHLFRVPLQSIVPGGRVNKDTALAGDFSSQTTVLYGVAYEMASAIKADDNRRSLQDMMLAAMSGQTMTLRDLDQPDRSASVYVVDPADTWTAVRDQRGAPWELETPLRFRRTDGSAFPDWWLYQAYGDSGLLLKWEPGMSLADATFTRAASANYTDIDGVVQSAGANVARDAHYQLVSSTWTRTLRVVDTDSEVLYFPFPHGPEQSLSFYLSFVERGGVTTANGYILAIGSDSTANEPYAAIYSNSSVYVAVHDPGTAVYSFPAGSAPTTGQAVELLLHYWSDGAIQIHQSIAGAATTSASKSTTSGPGTAWYAERLYLSGFSTGYSPIDWRGVKVAAGVQSMDHMRAL